MRKKKLRKPSRRDEIESWIRERVAEGMICSFDIGKLAKAQGFKGSPYEQAMIRVKNDVESGGIAPISRHQIVCNWMRGILEFGPCDSGELRREAAREGISILSISRARKSLGVYSVRGKGNTQTSYLPEHRGKK